MYYYILQQDKNVKKKKKRAVSNGKVEGSDSQKRRCIFQSIKFIFKLINHKFLCLTTLSNMMQRKFI